MGEIRRFISEEDGMAVVEVVLIVVVLIALVILFKSKITSLVEDIFKTISKKAASV